MSVPSRAEPRRAADCLQRPLRSRVRQRLTPGVSHHKRQDMADSAFIACVPEAEPRIGVLREQFDASARLGVPAHITVLYPFMSPAHISAATLEAVSTILRVLRPFRFTLNFCAKMEGINTMKIGPPMAYCLGFEGLETGGMPPGQRGGVYRR